MNATVGRVLAHRAFILIITETGVLCAVSPTGVRRILVKLRPDEMNMDAGRFARYDDQEWPHSITISDRLIGRHLTAIEEFARGRWRFQPVINLGWNDLDGWFEFEDASDAMEFFLRFGS